MTRPVYGGSQEDRAAKCKAKSHHQGCAVSNRQLETEHKLDNSINIRAARRFKGFHLVQSTSFDDGSRLERRVDMRIRGSNVIYDQASRILSSEMQTKERKRLSERENAKCASNFLINIYKEEERVRFLIFNFSKSKTMNLFAGISSRWRRLFLTGILLFSNYVFVDYVSRKRNE